MIDRVDRFKGILLGGAVGDALGLPMEGLSARRIERMFPGPLRHRFMSGRGMISDDTEHAVFVSQALLEYPDNASEFGRSLAWKLRWWLLGLPAGIGWATLRACLKLWCGLGNERSGVFSAGNGPAMRSAVLGAFFADDPHGMGEFVRTSTRLTHTDPRAFVGAMAVAVLAGWAIGHGRDCRPDLAEIRTLLLSPSTDDDAEWTDLVSGIEHAVATDGSVGDFAMSLERGSRGVSGYIYRTVPVAVFAWLKHYGDYESTVESVIRCGGDTDTVAAIAGALAGAVVGERGIPRPWVDGIFDRPITVELLEGLGENLARRAAGRVPHNRLAIIPRNMFFFTVVMCHALRRLFPPY